MELKSDGNIEYSINIDNNGWTPNVTTPRSTLVPNGVIYAEKGNVYIKGNLKGGKQDTSLVRVFLKIIL